MVLVKRSPQWVSKKPKAATKEARLELGKRMQEMTADEVRRLYRERMASAQAALTRMVPG